MNANLKYRKKLLVAKRPNFADFHDAKLRVELRRTIREEAVKNTKRLEMERLKGELDTMTRAVRTEALRRISALSKG